MSGFLSDFLFSILSGIVSGIIATLLLNWYYWNKKPNLKISDQIAKNAKNEYRLKIVNKSRFYVTNVFIQVQLVTTTNGNGGYLLHAANLDIPHKMLQIISPYNKKDENHSYAIRFVISRDLENVWQDDNNTYLKLIIYCSNEHNNASKLYEKKYHKKESCIKFGEFKIGDSLEIE